MDNIRMSRDNEADFSMRSYNLYAIGEENNGGTLNYNKTSAPRLFKIVDVAGLSSGFDGSVPAFRNSKKLPRRKLNVRRYRDF
jgi:hypothetical protein